MTAEEIKSLQDIKGTAGFRVVEFIANQALEELRDIDNLDETINTPIQTQALGKKYAVKYIKKFLNEINLSPTSEKDKRRTYE